MEVEDWDLPRRRDWEGMATEPSAVSRPGEERVEGEVPSRASQVSNGDTPVAVCILQS